MAIRRLLDDDKKIKRRRVSDAFYEHPLIKYFYTGSFLGIMGFRRPSYLSKETFSKVVTDMLTGNDVRPGVDYSANIQHSISTSTIKWPAHVKIEKETKTYFVSIWAENQGDIQKFRGTLEDWYTEMMERTTGWYKRYVQLILLIVGLLLAIGFNVDTLGIIQRLQDPGLRNEIVQQAVQFSNNHPDLTSKDAKEGELRDKLYTDAISHVSNDKGLSGLNNTLAIGWPNGFMSKTDFGWLSIIGWLLTALAVSLGAPFWFDLLNKLIQFRSAVGENQRKTPPKQKDGKQIKAVG